MRAFQTLPRQRGIISSAMPGAAPVPTPAPTPMPTPMAQPGGPAASTNSATGIVSRAMGPRMSIPMDTGGATGGGASTPSPTPAPTPAPAPAPAASTEFGSQQFRDYLNHNYNSTWDQATGQYVLNNGGWNFDNGDFGSAYQNHTADTAINGVGVQALGIAMAMGWDDATLGRYLGVSPQAIAAERAKWSHDIIAMDARGFIHDTGFGDPSRVQDQAHTVRNPDGTYTVTDRATGAVTTLDAHGNPIAGDTGGSGGGTGTGGGGGGGTGGIINGVRPHGSNGQWTGTQSGAAMLGDPAAWNVTPEQTLEGRIANLVSPNNPLNVQLRTQALEAGNARGFGNSALTESAAQDAIIRNAINIAGPDAATFAKAAGWNADQVNQFSVNNANYENQFRLTDKNNASQMEIAQLNAQTQTTIARLNIDAQTAANAIANTNRTLLETNGHAATAFNTAMSAISAIQNNDKMDAAAKTAAVANVWHDLQTQLRVLGSTSGIDLAGSLNFANYPGFDAQGNWTGNTTGTSENAAATQTFPAQIDGRAVNWNNLQAGTGVTLRQAYQTYSAGGGTMTPDDWYRAMSNTGWLENAGSSGVGDGQGPGIGPGSNTGNNSAPGAPGSDAGPGE